jgi:hypothetical protein
MGGDELPVGYRSGALRVPVGTLWGADALPEGYRWGALGVPMPTLEWWAPPPQGVPLISLQSAHFQCFSSLGQLCAWKATVRLLRVSLKELGVRVALALLRHR